MYLKGTAWYDLGAVFWVDNVSVVNKRINQSNKGAFMGPDILVSDGTLLKPVSMERPRGLSPARRSAQVGQHHKRGARR